MDTLTSVIKAVNLPNTSVRLRVRGDYRKLITLIQLYGIFQQNLLPPVYINGQKTVIMTPEKALEILKISVQPLCKMLTGSGEAVISILTGLDEYGINKPGAAIDKTLRDEIGRSIGLISATTRIYFNKLEKMGYLSSTRQGNTKTFHLLQNTASIRRNLSIVSEKLENSEDLIAQMYREGLEHLTRLCTRENPGDGETHTGENTETYEALTVIREMFRTRRPVSPLSPRVSVEGSSLSENTPQSDELRENQPNNGEIRDILCAFCRSVVEGDPIQHPYGPVCQACADEARRTVPLQERLQQVVNGLNICNQEAIRAGADGPVTANILLLTLQELYPTSLWIIEDVERVLVIAERDGVAFQPRPGFWRSTTS